MTSHIVVQCGRPEPEDREGRGTAIHCLPSRKRRDVAQLENAGRRVSPVLVGSRVEVFGRRNLASVRGDAVAFIRTGRVTPLNLVGPALDARYPFPPRVHDANQARGGFLVSLVVPPVAALALHKQDQTTGGFGDVRNHIGEIRNVVG